MYHDNAIPCGDKIIFTNAEGIKALEDITKKKRITLDEKNFIRLWLNADISNIIIRQSGAALLFFLKNIDVCPGAIIEKGEMYEKYKFWTIKNYDYNFVIGPNKISYLIKQFFMNETRPRAQRASGNRKRIWPNLTWKTILK